MISLPIKAAIRFVVVLIIGVSMSSCFTNYVVNSVHTPLLTQKNEIQAGLNLKTSEVFVTTFEPEASYALTDNIGIMYSGSYAISKNKESVSNSQYNKRNFTEFGAGYFDRFEENFQWEAYGGYGFGDIEEWYKLDDESEPVFNSAEYSRYFVQPTIAYITKNFNVALTTRIVYVDYTENTLLNNNFTAIEPVISLQFGNTIVFQTQIGNSYYLGSFLGEYNPFIFSVGLKYRFNRDQPLSE